MRGWGVQVCVGGGGYRSVRGWGIQVCEGVGDSGL